MDGPGREDPGWDRWIPGSAGILARADHGGVREPAGWKPALPGVVAIPARPGRTD